MIPDVDNMKMLVEGVEEAINTHGWDQEPMLGYVFDSYVNGVRGYGVAPFITQPQEHSKIVSEGLALIGATLQHPDCPGALPDNLYGRFCGLMFVSEGYMNTDAAVDDGRHLADIPGSLETRSVAVIDCAGRYYHLVRARGEKPKRMHVSLDGSETGGKVPAAMREIMLGIGVRAPQGTIDLDAVARIARDTEYFFSGQ